MVELEIAGQPLRGGPLRSVSDHREARRVVLVHAVEDADDIEYALHRAEIAHVEKQRLLGLGVMLAQRDVAGRRVANGVDEVGDDIDVTGVTDGAARLVAQVGGDRGDRVGAPERERRRRAVGRVRPDERDVGPVKRGHQPGAVACDLARQVRSHAVRDRVVGVENLKFVVRRNLGELAR